MMQADIAQIIERGWRNATSPKEIAAEILRECDASAQAPSAPCVQDVRWAVNVLLEKIAEKFEGWDTHDIWRSDAAMVVRGFKHPSVSSAHREAGE